MGGGVGVDTLGAPGIGESTGGRVDLLFKVHGLLPVMKFGSKVEDMWRWTGTEMETARRGLCGKRQAEFRRPRKFRQKRILLWPDINCDYCFNDR